MLRLCLRAVTDALFAASYSASVIIFSLSMFLSLVSRRESASGGLLSGLQVEGQGSREIIMADSAKVSSLTCLP